MPDLSVKQTVLIVDDEVSNIKVLSSLLRDELEILFATSGQAALDIARTKQPDLLLLDIMMPDLDGYEVCQTLKSDPLTRHIPVIFVSAKDQEQDEAAGFTAGAIDFITKPFSPLIVKARVRNHLDLIGQRDRLKQLSDQLAAYRHRVERELQTARETQTFLLPSPEILQNILENQQLEIQSQFIPCSELGGDYWGIKVLDAQRVAVLTVDFSGHGVNAALNTFRLHALLNDNYAYADNPANFLARLNARLAPLLPTGQFATMFYGIIDTDNDVIHYSGAATPHPLVLLPKNSAPLLGDGAGIPLGLFEDSNYENRTLPFPAGAALLLYSDAVTEGKLINGERLMESGLTNLLESHIIGLPDTQRFDALVNALDEGFQQPLSDDLTLLYISRKTELPL